MVVTYAFPQFRFFVMKIERHTSILRIDLQIDVEPGAIQLDLSAIMSGAIAL